jgi:hypothetical protein
MALEDMYCFCLFFSNTQQEVAYHCIKEKRNLKTKFGQRPQTKDYIMKILGGEQRRVMCSHSPDIKHSRFFAPARAHYSASALMISKSSSTVDEASLKQRVLPNLPGNKDEQRVKALFFALPCHAARSLFHHRSTDCSVAGNSLPNALQMWNQTSRA